MDFRILGPIEVRRDGSSVPLGGPKRRALLAILVLHANEVVSADRIADELWGEQTPQNAAAALHNHVSRLRKLLGADALATHAGGYVLLADPGAIDLCRFERLVADADDAPPDERARLLREALALWRGPPLADVAFEPFAAAETVRLEEARLAALERRVDADLELGRHGDLVGELEALVAKHPLRERFRAQLIVSLYRAGRQADALDAYREARRVLDEELGLEPSAELRDLERAILRHDPSLAPPHVARAASPAKRRRRTLVFAVAVVAILLAAALIASLAVRSSSTTVAAREPVRVTPPAAPPATTGEAPPEPAPKPQGATTERPEQKAAPAAVAATTRSPTRPVAPATKPARTTRTTRPAPASTTKPAASPRPAPTKALRLDDDFAAGFPDPIVWHYVGRDNGAAFNVRGGRLEISVAADATPDAQWNQVGGHVGTRCRFDGDFDARVDFELLDWPAGSNVYAGLNAIYADSAVVRQASARWGDNYASWVVPANVGVELADQSGRLRIRREGSTMSTYMWREGRWLRLARGTSRGAAVLALQAQANGDEFAHVPVRVAFDNFVVEAPDADCPPGSDPRDA